MASMLKTLTLAGAMAIALAGAAIAQTQAPARTAAQTPAPTQPQGQTQTVTADQLSKGLADPGSWLNYSGDYGGQRHSPLTQVTPANVNQLSTQWAFQTGQLGKFEGTPIVLNGVMYVTGPENTAWAIDARTGR